MFRRAFQALLVRTPLTYPYAPNGGRLHLKWGEALGYAGRKDEAQAQYQKASTLDLGAADKTELARQTPHA